MNDKLICGLKLTHDGAVALIRGRSLLFSVEMEKLDNNPRFSPIDDLISVQKILSDRGYALTDIDHFVIDGWAGLNESWIETSFMGRPLKLPVAAYRETKLSSNVMAAQVFDSLPLAQDAYVPYTSFMHVTGHIAGGYCTSPFAVNNESSYILVWDGGMFPRLYYFNASDKSVKSLGDVFFLTGNFYSIFASYFHPFNQVTSAHVDDRTLAGKVMAYVAKGQVVPDIVSDFDDILEKQLDLSMGYVHQFVQLFRKRVSGKNYRDEDILASMHSFLEKQLLTGLRAKLKRYDYPGKNLCFVGGCALNIKWNSAIRESGLVRAIWIPPFPNDSGSALGAACARMLELTPYTSLAWNVFSGPDVIKTSPQKDWRSIPCSLKSVAAVLSGTNLPVIILSGPAELGPRALGGRSIIAPAVDPAMKDVLNEIKNREFYRPVAPICLEEEAPSIFYPGTPDPLMLYEHRVREAWKDKIPAVCHLDGSARLQTVRKQDNPTLYAILSEYKKMTGIPVLCNTSANYNGKGFFPDVTSAMKWGKVHFIWSEGYLYVKNGFEPLLEGVVSVGAKKSEPQISRRTPLPG